MKFTTLVISLFILSCSTFAQVSKVKLTDQVGKNFVFNQNIPVFPVANAKIYKGYDTASYTNWSIRSFVLNSTQYAYEISPNQKSFTDYAVKYKLDTANVFRGKIERNAAAVFVGITNNGLKHVIVDQNNNKDFADDQVYIFNLNNKEELPIVHIEFDVLQGKDIISKKFAFILDPYSNPIGAKGNEALHQINMINRAYKEGLVTLGKKNYRVQISNQYQNAYRNYSYLVNITSVPLDTNSNNYYRFTQHEELLFDNEIYTIDSFSDDEMAIRFKKKVDYNGAKVATYAPDFSLKDYLTKEMYNLKKNKGSYLLIDFWGSWCVPCIENIPKLVEAKNKLKNKNIQFVSIAYDDLKDTTILKKLISENKMDWTHLLIPKNAKLEGAILKDYQIQVYPTIVVIDKQGQVIYRGTGENGVSKGIDFIDKLFLK